uniref:Disease resistance RPP13-like protein 1 n=1 Tax=Vitis vinifera TaxID=29760 RepID=F6GX79_VITVI
MTSGTVAAAAAGRWQSMFVAEAVGSSFIGVLIDKLIASPLLEYARRKKVDRTLEEWRKTLTHIEAVVDDAENKQIREKAVKVWLDDLKSLAYDIEDVVDEFDTEAKQRSLTEGPQASTSKVRKLIPTFGALDPRAMSFNKKMGEKINKITRELDAIAKRRLDLHLREGVGGVSFGIEERLPTTSLVDESRIHGRDADKEKIIELMLSDEATQVDKVSVISIVGMGGIGKTTLAQIIYNDGRVENHFEKRVWVCVSDDFDVVGITKAILESITKCPCEFKTLESLQEKLKNEMKDKRFLLVLDDVWNEKTPRWDLLQAPFNVAARGSVVLVTTRNETVAAIMRTTTSSHQLGQLAEEQCWLLFAQTALTNLDSNECQNLESTGRKIAKKCKGLPLVAKTLGGLLHSNQDITAWNEVLNNEIWDLSNEQSSILPALNLSYHYLPTTLKRCFAYCSIFPKDYVFEREKLVLLWMAEGFLDGSKRGETIEQFGRKCFNSLLLRSFFQQYDNNDSQFVMHDLIHDLAQFTSGKFCFRLEVEQQNQISKEIRHSSSVVHLPSITELEVSNICSIQVELPTILLKLTSLRKLVIKECQSLSSLPEMGLPPMLETLRIEKCHILETLPEGMTLNNTSLQSLYIEDCDSLTSLPIISSLKSLEIKQCGKVELPLPEETSHNYYPWLTSLHIDGSCDSLTSFPLAFFTKLETLYIGCENLESFYIPDGLRNMDLTSLRRIEIYDCPNLVSFPQGGLPASNLRNLEIWVCMKLKSLPQRMHTLLTSLENLTIDDCPEIVSFPEGGLPTNLSSLYIWDCYKLMESRKEWGLQTLPSLGRLVIAGGTEEGLESFSEEWLLLPSTLFSLEIRSFPDLKSLDNLGLENLTSLERLVISDCVKLKSFPKQGLPASLSILEIHRCPVLKKRCQRDKGKEWRKIAHIPRIKMDGEVMD